MMSNGWPSFLIVALLVQSYACYEEKHCPSAPKECPRNEIIHLPDLEEDIWIDRDKAFFIECADRNHLDPRQACSVESAARNAAIPVLMLLTSLTLDLSVSNSTCHLYDLYSERQLFFRHLSKDKVFKGSSALEELHASGRMEKSEFSVVQYSDALRLVLMYKLGGLYADLDMLILKPLSELKNFLTGDHLMLDDPQIKTHIGQSVNNGVFHFDSGHPFMLECIKDFALGYDPEIRMSGGPILMTKIYLSKMCSVESVLAARNMIGPKEFPPEVCQGINILPQIYFYPYGWFKYTSLYHENKSPELWKSIFKDSYGVHFYNSSPGVKNFKIMKPKYYGKDWPAFLFLASEVCPISLNSVKNIF